MEGGGDIPAWHGNQGLESEQDSPQACRAEPAQVKRSLILGPAADKGQHAVGRAAFLRTA